jgi:integrase
MLSFRSAKAQAQHAINRVSAVGTSSHKNRSDGKVRSLGTSRNYQQSIKGFASYLQETRQGDISTATRELALYYLEERSAMVGQKQLDMDRQALQSCLCERLPVIRAERESLLTSRAYTQEQLNMVIASQKERNAIATEIAAAAGLRAHELLTLRPATERPASSHREWRQDRFEGREGVLYTVQGKGGLVREIILQKEVSERLETRRLETDRTTTDRGIYRCQIYDISGGRNWSQSFSAASKRALGWSQGGHGCRHTYAQSRVSELQERGYSYGEAKAVVAQELGHFRCDEKLIGAYLR